MANGFAKNPELYDYEANTPEARNTYSTPKTNEDWDTIDKTLLALFEAGNAADWAQTRQIHRTPGMYEMKFPYGSQELIGKQPNNAKTTALMGGQAIAMPLIANQLPSGWRKLLLGAAALSKGFAVKNNMQGGPDAGGVALDAVRW